MKIACLNVRGLNKKQKQNQIKKYIENEKWDVTILNETKIKENQGKTTTPSTAAITTKIIRTE